MPSIEENANYWSSYEWPEGGDEWSEVWGGTPFIWNGSVFPRIRSFLPKDGHLLEIAPGFGRFTQYLRNHCREIEIVDLSDRCIEACKKRFAQDDHFTFHVTDGLSLEMIADDSVDFAFSFDSLVHAEANVLESYVTQLARKLKAGGVAFLHHSNLDGLKDADGKLPFENQHWRAESMSADLLASYCANAGLEVISQELVNWGGVPLTDCFSVFAHPGSKWAPARGRHENPTFMDEAVALGRVAKRYHHA